MIGLIAAFVVAAAKGAKGHAVYAQPWKAGKAPAAAHPIAIAFPSKPVVFFAGEEV